MILSEVLEECDVIRRVWFTIESASQKKYRCVFTKAESWSVNFIDSGENCPNPGSLGPDLHNLMDLCHLDCISTFKRRKSGHLSMKNKQKLGLAERQHSKHTHPCDKEWLNVHNCALEWMSQIPKYSGIVVAAPEVWCSCKKAHTLLTALGS